MKKLFQTTLIFLFLFLIKTANGQSNFVTHTLKSGETLSTLAKQYNTNVGDIMRINGMHADSKLVYGSAIKIPSNKKSKTEVEQPLPVKTVNVTVNKNTVKHTVAKGETLYSISKQYNVSTDQIKAWNNLADNSVKIGSDLIVGTNNNLSAQTDKNVDETKRQRVGTTQPIETNNVIVPEQKTETANTASEEKQVDNTDTKTTETLNNQTVNTNNDFPVNNVSSLNEGFFQYQFSGKIKRKQHISGVSKTFKTSSGWSDGKYYILADNINPGTVVKITSDNGKSVYAKVLWNMGDLKENNNVDFRVSNATAAALHENADAFNLTVYY